jgi:putative ATP-dependent endonuclease of OLD family
MQISELKIDGFRGVKNARLRLSSHNVLIGPNNCGKTTVIEALALLFGRDRLIRELTEHDFFGSNPAPADRLSIVATISGFDGDDPNDFPNWFREDRAIPKWLNLSDGVLHAQRV